KIHLYDLEVTNELTVYDSASLKLHGATITGTFGFTGELIVGSGAKLSTHASSTMTMEGPLVRDGASARHDRSGRVGTLADANGDVAVTDNDIWIVPTD